MGKNLCTLYLIYTIYNITRTINIHKHYVNVIVETLFAEAYLNECR